MYEHKTFENILGEVLNNVRGDIDKREGSVVYDAVAPVCAELAKAYIELDRVLDESFADTQSREFLVRRASERGVEPYEATYAKVMGSFKGNFELTGGERFNLGEINFIYEGETALNENGEKVYVLRCESIGTIGNADSGRLIPIESVEGLEKAEVAGVYYYGEDEEDTENFRERYFESLKNTAFGGNISDYKQKVKEISGVGGVKVYPHFYGGGTVKLVVTDSEYMGDISNEFVEELGKIIDPKNNSGEGRGLAPIGHKVSVYGAEKTEVVVELLDISFSGGHSFDDLSESLLEEIKVYFKELNKTFENCDRIVINNVRLGARLLTLDGILNIGGIKINGNSGNLQLEENNVIDISAVRVEEAEV